jgi:DNA-binding response OmpR family regulator
VTVLRRVSFTSENGLPEVEFGELVIDFVATRPGCPGLHVHLTPKEFTLLSTLSSSQGALTRLELLEQVFGFDYQGFERTVDVHVMNLRKKIERDPSHPRYVQTVYGIGYKFEDGTGA